LDTVNKFFNIDLENEEELKIFLKSRIKKIKNSEDVIISKFGEELYETFVKNYTKKQWDKYPHELKKEVLERLPVRYDKNPFYFNDSFQEMPKKGFTKMFKKMVGNKNTTLKLNFPYKKGMKKIAKKIIWTGRIDEYFNYKLGNLEYRGDKICI